MGAAVDPLTLSQTVDRVAELVTRGGAHQVVTLNPEYLYRAQQERHLLDIVRAASLVTADGVGILWAARVSGLKLPERVTGIDLMLALCKRAAAEGWRIFLLGGKPGAAEKAASRLTVLFPKLVVAGTYHGYFTGGQETAVLEKIRTAQPHILFVGLGAPKQEEWIYKHKPLLGVPVAVGVGGSFDVLSGRVRRAPVWMRRLGLEWLGRLIHEPRRWRRMLVLPRFAFMVLRQQKSVIRSQRSEGMGADKESSEKNSRSEFRQREMLNSKSRKPNSFGRVPKIVISGYYGFRNSGDEAMLFAIISQLKQRIPGLEAVVLSERPHDTAQEFGVRAVPRRAVGTIWRELKDADLLLSGGGTLFQDVTSFRSVVYYTGVIFMAWLGRKKICIYGQGIGPLRFPLSRLLVKAVLRVADLVTLRDRDSLAELEAMGVKRAVHVTADPVLALDAGPGGCEQGRLLLRKAGAAEGPLLGISLRRWPGIDTVLDAVAELADRMASQGWRAVLVPLQPGDGIILGMLKERMRSPAVVLDNLRGFRDLLSVAACFDLCLGMRLHFLVFAVMSGVPSVGISYDPKVERFMHRVGLPALSVAGITAVELQGAVDGLLTGEAPARLSWRVEGLRRKARHNADLVAALLSSGR